MSGAASIADQPRINRDPDCVNHRMLLLYLTLFTAENRQNNKHGYIVYRHGVSDGLFRRVEHRGSTANQSRISSTCPLFKIELIWFVGLWALLFWFFFAIGYHYWTQFPNKPEYQFEETTNNHIDFEWFILLQEPTLIQQMFVPIADQLRRRVSQSRMLKYTCPFIILRLAFAIGCYMMFI